MVSFKNLKKNAILPLFTVFVIPAEYENIYNSSLTSYSSGVIRFGQVHQIVDAGRVISINPVRQRVVQNIDAMCYDIPKIQCNASRIPNISTSIKTATMRDPTTGGYLKLHSIYAGAFDNGNTWRICAIGTASTTVSNIQLAPCWSNSSGICIQLQYTPEGNSVKSIIDFNAISNGNAIIDVAYKQNCI